jgi:hypothetical protein
MKTIYLLVIFVFVFVFAFSCNKNDNELKLGSATVSNMSLTSCLKSLKSTDSDNPCVTIRSNGDNKLTITHNDAEFCCDATSINIDIKLDVKGDTIVIQEADTGTFAYCYCKHDISFDIGLFDYGNYKVKIIESEHSYSRDTIIFEFNHSDSTNFTSCE